MKLLKYITLIPLALFSAQSSAINLTEINQTGEESLYDSRSCNDLYMQASILEKQSYNNAGYGERTQIASFMSTVFAPAIYYMGFSAYQDYKNGIRFLNIPSLASWIAQLI
ncbi:MAG TPA: hypothetical protein EYQ42_09535 [Thiotrichaceae bacterium]|jgi:hypothetical protein|nr:hypothetical protein [Thiotrichaceae bacterium]